MLRKSYSSKRCVFSYLSVFLIKILHKDVFREANLTNMRYCFVKIFILLFKSLVDMTFSGVFSDPHLGIGYMVFRWIWF